MDLEKQEVKLLDKQKLRNFTSQKPKPKPKPEKKQIESL